MSDPRRRRHALWSSVSIATIAAIVALVLTFAGGGTAASKAVPTNQTEPSISGTTTEGSTLTADHGSWNDNGSTITGYTYTWLRCDQGGSNCNAVQGPNGNNQYTLVSNDITHTMRVSVVAQNGSGDSQPKQSNKTNPVTAAGTKPQNTVQPSISGTPQDNQTLTASDGSWTGNPTSFTYQWRRCDSSGNNCSDINGATSKTYLVSSNDVGHTIRVTVTAHNAAGASSEGSNATNVVTAATSTSAPVNTVRPSISGTAQDGQTLTASVGTWNPNSGNNFTYQWQRCDSNANNCSPISGATSNTYRCTSSDVGHRLLVQVTATNSSGQGRSTSLPTSVVSSAGSTTSTSTTSTTTTTPTPGKVIPIANVVPPNRLVVSSTRWTPRTIGAVGQQITARIRIIDASGTSVSGALVYATGVPFNRVSIPPETFTDASGWATLQFITLKGMPIKRGALLQVFIRTRKQGEDILGGVSSRRLVSVRVVPT